MSHPSADTPRIAPDTAIAPAVEQHRQLGMVGPETAIREIGVTGASVLVLAEWRGTAVILTPVQPVCALRRHAHHL